MIEHPEIGEEHQDIANRKAAVHDLVTSNPNHGRRAERNREACTGGIYELSARHTLIGFEALFGPRTEPFARLGFQRECLDHADG